MVRTLRPVRGTATMAAASVVARFGYAMVNVAVLLFVQGVTGSYTAAGAVSAASLVGTALGTVVQGRVIDAVGPARTLVAVAPLHGALGVVAVTTIASARPVAAMAAAAAAQCATIPSMAVASRAMWPHLLAAGPLREAAYGYEAVTFELCWLLGPAASAVLATTVWPGAGLVAAVAVVTLAAVAFAASPAVRSHRGVPRTEADGASTPGGPASVHRSGLGVLLVAAGAFGLAIGCAVVGATAGTAAVGAPRLIGPLLVAWSVASIVGGLAYQRRPWPAAVPLRLPPMLAALGAVMLLPSVVPGIAGLVLTMMLAGLTLVPQVTAHNSLLDGLVPRHRLSSAYGWLTTVVVVANAAGQALGGAAIERLDHRASYVLAAVAVLPAAALVWFGRRSLAGQPADVGPRTRRA